MLSQNNRSNELSCKRCAPVMSSGRTVRQVKHGERLRRSQNSFVPLTKPEKPVESAKNGGNNQNGNNVVRIKHFHDYVHLHSVQS